jgi:predicted pyridoxine 5'-phosphate oxidase superfamily flavin-nucleotide-binding protein
METMALPSAVREAWADREGPVILATVNEDGVPNIIYATCVSLFGDDRIVVADNYFDKTRRNLQAGAKIGAILFLDKSGKAYQAKGSLEYHTSGEVFDHMKTWNPEKHPGHAAAALRVEEVYSGAKKLV